VFPFNEIIRFSLEYENLTRDYEKSKNVIAKEGIPNFFIKCLGDLEDYIQQVFLTILNLLEST